MPLSILQNGGTVVAVNLNEDGTGGIQIHDADIAISRIALVRLDDGQIVQRNSSQMDVWSDEAERQYFFPADSKTLIPKDQMLVPKA